MVLRGGQERNAIRSERALPFVSTNADEIVFRRCFRGSSPFNSGEVLENMREKPRKRLQKGSVVPVQESNQVVSPLLDEAKGNGRME